VSEDVIIAGAGPVGLMLSCELRLLGVRPVVLERLEEPTGLSKALGIQGRGVDLLELRGLLERFAREGAVTPGLAHFAGIRLDVSRLKERPPKFLFIPQARTEALLEARARELGVDLRRGRAVVGLDQDGEGVTVEVHGPEGTTPLRGQYLVGCDGGRSLVRELAGIEFPGAPATMLMRIGDVKLDVDAVPAADGARRAFGLAIPLDDGYVRVTTREPLPERFDRDAPMTLDELRDSIQRTHGVDVKMTEARWLSRFTDASRQAEPYRRGRIFVAGDAAHVHLPAGGPGLSTGLNDAANLGWKLAATVHGWAPPGLLDTYHAERHAAGRRVLLHTRAQGALIVPGDRVAALREVLGELFQREDALRFITDLVQGADTRYDMSETDPHPLVGRWLPELAFESREGLRRLAELLYRARGVLVDLGGCPGLAEVAAGWADRIDVVAGRTTHGPPSVDALLVRPDGYVAWVAADGEPGDEATRRLAAALARWFGLPRQG
jgi:2-polyprenyl-6-methoxyphenol hydroxylase-like FAD-dependent oxidoreductase